MCTSYQNHEVYPWLNYMLSMGLGLDSALSSPDTRMRWWKDPTLDPVHHSDGEENPGWSSMGSLCATE